MQVRIYTDGSAQGNPGPGGFGVVLQYTSQDGKLHEKELSSAFRKTTNNRMELLAVITGLEALTKPCDVDVYSDSQYVVKAINDHWIEGWIRRGWKNASKEPVKNVDLWKRLLEVLGQHQVTFHWVKGHAGHEMNERCDELARSASEAGNLRIDEVYEQTHQA